MFRRNEARLNGLLEFNVLCREKITMDYPHS